MNITGFGSYFNPLNTQRNSFVQPQSQAFGYGNTPSPFAMTGGMQFPMSTQNGVQSLVNGLLGQSYPLNWANPGQGMPVNPFPNYSGYVPPRANPPFTGLNSSINQATLLELLQGLLNSRGLFNDQPIKNMDPPKPNTPPQPPKAKDPVISGKGSIIGTSFKSGDNESYTLDVKAGKTYNLLSDKGFGINGRYSLIGDGTASQLGLSELAMNVNGSSITFDNNGYLEIDGRKFSRTNDLGGAIKRNSNGSYTILSGEYETTIARDASRGIKVNLTGTNVLRDGVVPEGLWGSTFDGEKETTAEIQRMIRESSYEIDRLTQFDYEDNNNIGAKSTKASDSAEEDEIARNLNAWQRRENNYASVTASMLDGALTASADGSTFNSVINLLKEGRIYNLFSDAGIQLGGKFTNVAGKNIATNLGFYVDGREVTFERGANGGAIIAKVNGTTVDATNLSSFSPYLTQVNGNYVVTGGEDGETHKFTIANDGTGLGISDYSGSSLGSNATRSSGLLAEMIGSRTNDPVAGYDDNLAGYIRNKLGLQTSLRDSNIADALAGYELSSYSDTDGGWSSYQAS